MEIIHTHIHFYFLTFVLFFHLALNFVITLSFGLSSIGSCVGFCSIVVRLLLAKELILVSSIFSAVSRFLEGSFSYPLSTSRCLFLLAVSLSCLGRIECVLISLYSGFSDRWKKILLPESENSYRIMFDSFRNHLFRDVANIEFELAIEDLLTKFIRDLKTKLRIFHSV